MDSFFIAQDWLSVFDSSQLKLINHLANALLGKFREALLGRHLPSPLTVHPSGSDGREHNEATIWLIWKAMLKAALQRSEENGPEAEVMKSMLERPMTFSTRDACNRVIRKLQVFMEEDVTKERKTRPDGDDWNMWDALQADKVITDVGVILYDLLYAPAVILEDTPMGDC